MKLRILFLAGALCAVAPLRAGGPVYTRYGIGDLTLFGSSRAAGMGLFGTALRGDGFINVGNPAGLAGILRTRFSGSFFHNGFTSEAGGSSSSSQLAGLEHIAFAIPIAVRYGVTLGLDTGPYSSIGYDLTRRDDQSGITSTQSFYGRGGLSTIGVACSWSALQDLHVGAKLSYIYGRVRQYTKITFDNSTFATSEIDRSDFYQGVMFTVGAIVDRPDRLLGLDLGMPFSLGLTAALPSSPTVELNRAYLTMDTVLTQNGTATIPFRGALGLTARPAERLLVGADLVMQDWTSASIPGTAPANLGSAFMMAAGAELQPIPNNTSYLKRIAYRIGGGYGMTPVRINGTGIGEWYASAGVSLPIGPDARLDLGFRYGVRGTTDNGLQQDRYVRISAALSGSELWFMNFDEE